MEAHPVTEVVRVYWVVVLGVAVTTDEEPEDKVAVGAQE
jgi:hypothetical protein